MAVWETGAAREEEGEREQKTATQRKRSQESLLVSRGIEGVVMGACII